MCHIEIGLCAQNIDTIVGSILNSVGKIFVIIQRSFHFDVL